MSTGTRSSYLLLVTLSALVAISACVIVGDIRAKGPDDSDGADQRPTVGLTVTKADATKADATKADAPQAAPLGVSAEKDIGSILQAGPLTVAEIDGRLQASMYVDVYTRDGDAKYLWALQVYKDRDRKDPTFSHLYRDLAFDLGGVNTKRVWFEEFLDLQPGEYELDVRLLQVHKQTNLDELADTDLESPRSGVGARASVVVP